MTATTRQEKRKRGRSGTNRNLKKAIARGAEGNESLQKGHG